MSNIANVIASKRGIMTEHLPYDYEELAFDLYKAADDLITPEFLRTFGFRP